MMNNRLSFRTARPSSRGGFTLVELLVVIGIIAILAGVALGPITSGIERAKENAALQTARSINTLLFTYSIDNGAYPIGTGSHQGTSEGVAIQLLQGKYLTDPSLFAFNSADKYAGAGGDYGDFGANNIKWDFMSSKDPVSQAISGLTSADSDLIPTVFNTGETVIPVAGGLNITLTGHGNFGKNGMAVAYKGNNAFFLKSKLAGTDATVQIVPTSYSDTTTYNQIKP